MKVLQSNQMQTEVEYLTLKKGIMLGDVHIYTAFFLEPLPNP
jgi:hypothetical protein